MSTVDQTLIRGTSDLNISTFGAYLIFYEVNYLCKSRRFMRDLILCSESETLLNL